MSVQIDGAATYRFDPIKHTQVPLTEQEHKRFQGAIDDALAARKATGGSGDLKEGSERVVVVDAKDTRGGLSQIAKENHVSYQELLNLNNRTDIPNLNVIQPGQVIFIPTKPEGEGTLAETLTSQGKGVSAGDTAKTAAMAGDVRSYLQSLPMEQRQDAVLRLYGMAWGDAGPAVQASITQAAQGEGLTTNAEEAFAQKLYDLGNTLEYADNYGDIDYGTATKALADDVRAYLQTLPEDQRQNALQRLFDRDWRDAGPAEQAIRAASDVLPPNAPRAEFPDARTPQLAVSSHMGADVEHDARAIISNALQNNSPDGAFRALNDSYANASPEVRQVLLHSDGTEKILNDAAQWAVDGLKDVEKADGDLVPVMHMMERLDSLTKGADKTLATELMTAATPKIEAANEQALRSETGSPLQTGPQGARLLMQIAGRIAGTPEGDAVISRLANLGFYDMNEIRNAIGEGTDPAYAIELAADGGSSVFTNDVVPGLEQFRSQVGRDVDAYNSHMEELNWRVANYQGAMTQEQLDRAIADFKRNHPDWEREQQRLERKLSQDGEALLARIQQLQNLPPELSGQREAANQEINRILEDPKATFAIQKAWQNEPKLLDSPQMQNTIAQVARLSDRGRKLAEEATTQWVRAQLSSIKAAGSDNVDINKLQSLLDRFEKTGGRMLGMSDVDINKVTKTLRDALPQPGDSDEAKLARLRTMDRQLDEFSSRDGVKTFNRRERLGQMLRGIGLAANFVTLTQSAPQAFNDPSVRNWLKVASDTAGISQKSIELMGATGILSDSNKAVVLLGGSDRPLVKGLGVFSAIFDLANAGDAFERGDVPSGIMSLTSATGTVIAALGTGTMAGPIGLGIVAASVIGQMVWGQISKVNASNKYMNDTSAEFLRFAGFNDTAAHVLVDQSGDGYSPVPLLAKYAQEKGYDLTQADQQQKFVNWINSMPKDKLETLRDNIHHTLDNIGGDVSKFKQTADSDSGWSDVHKRPVIVSGRGSVQTPSIADQINDKNAAPASVKQLDLTLQVLGLPALPTV